MLVYYMNLTITTILNLSSRLSKNQLAKRILAVIAITIVTLVAGIRYNVGTDFQNYVVWFESLINRPINFQNLNIGFNILIKVIQLFTSNPQLLFFITAVVINTLMFLFVKDNTKFYDLGFFLFITLYFYYSSLNIIRQWIAIAIFFYALKYACDKKIWKFLIATLIATSFHITALIMLPIYFLLRMKLNKKNVIILLVSIVLLVILMNTLGVTVATQMGLQRKYINYLKFDITSSDSGGYAYLIFAIITIGVIIKNYSKYLKQNEYGEYHIKLLIVTAIVTLLSANSMIFNRIQLYFVPILIVCIPNLLNLIEDRKKRTIIYLFILLLGTAYMTRSLINNGGRPLPYMTIFDI